MAGRSLTQVMPDAKIWSQITRMRTQERMLQAGLVIVPPAMHLEPFLDRMLAHIVCLDTHTPCGSCRMCLKVLSDSHPDIYRIQPENPTGATGTTGTTGSDAAGKKPKVLTNFDDIS